MRQSANWQRCVALETAVAANQTVGKRPRAQASVPTYSDMEKLAKSLGSNANAWNELIRNAYRARSRDHTAHSARKARSTTLWCVAMRTARCDPTLFRSVGRDL